MSTVQIIQGNFSITDPSWPRLQMWVPGEVFTSDDFSTAGDPIGRKTGAELGGTPVSFLGPAGSWDASNGELVNTGSNGSILLEALGGDYETSVKIKSFAVTGSVLVIARRTSVDYHANISQLRVEVNNAGDITLRQQLDGTLSVIGTSPAAVSVGDTVTIRVAGTSVAALVNDQIVAEAETHVTGAGYAGLATSRVNTDSVVDDLILRALPAKAVGYSE